MPTATVVTLPSATAQAQVPMENGLHGSNVGLNIFDSHARDIYGRSHPQGTCVLLEVSSLNNLVHYFQSINNNDIFELKGCSQSPEQSVSKGVVTQSNKFHLLISR